MILTKNIIKGMALVAIMGISSIAIISCNDEDESRMDKQTTTGVQKATPITYTVREFHRAQIGDIDSIWCVDTKPGNCLPEVLITSTRMNDILDNFRGSIDRNDAPTYIRRNRTALEEYFRSTDLDGVINGELSVSYQKRYKTFIMFTNIRTKEVVGAYPFVLSE